MTPTDEAAFIALWNAGTETAAIGCQLGFKATKAHPGLAGAGGIEL